MLIEWTLLDKSIAANWETLPYPGRMQQIARWTRYFYDLHP